MQKKIIIPELLAPAGGMKQLKAAVENGADAVYMGGKLFNARMTAENFDFDDLTDAVEYAHLKGVKLYVTMNTLLTDSQLGKAIEYAVKLYEIGVDALIVQDLGFGVLIKKYIPDINLHLSTQATIYNAEGVEKATQLGFKRIVLARETNLEEIKEITEKNVAEIEMFVHGALCICYSGQCEMSHEIGGRSGNLGTCAQPCRLPYDVYKVEVGEKVRIGNTGFHLSPKDLSTIDSLDKIIETGVASLKIEGRLKSAEYVATVTRIYRKYLDIYADDGKFTVSEEDKKDLAQIFNRGGFTEGYLYGTPKGDLITTNLSKHQGILIGKALANGEGLIKVELTDTLTMGDGVEFRNKYLPGNIVTYMAKGNTQIKRGYKDEKIVIGDIKSKVRSGDLLYKLTDMDLMEKAAKTYEGKSWVDEKNLKKINIKAYFSLNKRMLSLKLIDEEGVCITVLKQCDENTGNDLNYERVKKQMLKTGGTPFSVIDCEIRADESLNVPISVINGLRREALEKLENTRKNKGKRSAPFIDVKSVMTSLCGCEKIHNEKIKTKKSLYIMDEKKLLEIIDLKLKTDILYVPFRIFMNNLDLCKALKDDCKVVPTLGSVTKGLGDEWLRKNFENFINVIEKVTGERNISLGNISWIEKFANSEFNIYGDFGLNLYNSVDFKLVSQMGISVAMISHELSRDQLTQINFHGVTPEIYNNGRIPIMIIETPLIFNGKEKMAGLERGIKDRKGAEYKILRDWENEKTYIFNFKESKEIDHDIRELSTKKLVLRTYV